MENKVNEFDVVFSLSMTNDEIEVYKIALMYEEQFKKIFSDVDAQSKKINRLPIRTDPRKSSLFRYCWKLRRETRGLLEFRDYKDYIAANLILLKITVSRTRSPITPMSITGDKGWIRYKIWKRKVEAKLAEASAQMSAPSANTTDPKIIQQIDRTKKFIFEKCEGSPSADKIRSFIDGGMFKFWVMTGKISQYYIVMSPFMAAATELSKFAENCGFSLALVREKCTKDIHKYFRHEFKHEFNDSATFLPAP